jgi:hypothetical protein
MRARLLLAAGVLSLVGGCVERRFVIESDPPGALLYVNGVPIGPTPVDVPYIYFGKYDFTLVKDGYETQHIVERAPGPWYAYPPIDFVAENIYPFRISDVIRKSYTMQPVPQPSSTELLQKADELRQRGKAEARPNPYKSSSNAPPAQDAPAAPSTMPTVQKRVRRKRRATTV